MADLDYGSTVPPFIKANKSISLEDGTGSPVTLSITDYTGELMASEPQRVSVSYKPNGRRPATPGVLETDDQEIELTLKIGLKSWKGSTTHTPLEFMRGETVNAQALTSTGAFGKFLFTLVHTYNNGTTSQTVTYEYVEYVSGTETETDGIMYIEATLRAHQNAPTYA